MPFFIGPEKEEKGSVQNSAHVQSPCAFQPHTASCGPEFVFRLALPIH